MDIQTLKYYVCVAESLSFTEAASQTGVSQSAISQQISELEKNLGTQLIVRNKRPLQLTWAGKVLFEEASILISSSEKVLKKVQLAANGTTGYLSIGFLGGIEKVFLPQAMRDFRNLYPDIYGSLHQYNWAEINEALMKEELDVGFTLSHRLKDFPDLVGKSLRSDVLCVVVHHSHPFASQKTIDVSTLAKEPFVMFTRKADYLLNDLTYTICAEYGFIPNIVNQSRDLSALLFMVEAGIGIMIIPGPVREVAGPELRVIELSYPNRYFDVMVAWNRNNVNTSIPLFVEHLASYPHKTFLDN
ncbi:LysR family transcriptional regulator [Desulfosporosinus fructosivorans]|uniref:LysR family transcriptional regulator n=1 Tax=Desulfosporosinus fructosivorans TaxID=2018669 RepID=A0A4Z0R8A6_9FIRM|nr:LysR family transcriptional regulator [Desulfosporosinus fructosivorans]TGE38383.1 LysR family transcriptional regulator [Desulfosporosinus fructosivorans]